MPPELLLVAVMGVGLALYFLFGGADFGGGVWDLLASGPRAARQRQSIEQAIGPIWEANHVWLILVVVVLFTAFPPAFAAISVALHIPLTLFLVGIVLRGSAFAFRGLAVSLGGGDRKEARFGLAFSIASTVAPVLLGMVVGALVSGRIRVRDGVVTSGFIHAWLAPFPLAVGIFALALCAFLAATYLCAEVADPPLREDFRRRALAAAIAVGVSAAIAFLLSREGAPRVRETLADRSWSWPFHALTGAAAMGALWALATRRFRVARLAAAAQVALILTGWALAQYPYLVVPDVTVTSAAASARTQHLLLIVLGAGLPILVPSLLLLFRVFKSSRARAT